MRTSIYPTPLRVFAMALLIFLCVFTGAVFVLSFTSSFSQSDTTRGGASVSKTQELIKLNAEKSKEYEAQKDTANLILNDMGKLNPKADRLLNSITRTESNLKKLAANPAAMQIERTYRIDTSPRPVVIQLISPVPIPDIPRSKSWFRKRD